MQHAKVRIAFFISILVFIWGGIVVQADSTATPAVKKGFSLKLIGLKPMDAKTFEIGKVAPGGVVDVTLLVENETTKDLTFERVETSCKCTTAQVRQTTIEHKDSIDCSFQFRTSNNPREIEENFSATIWCAGGREIIRVGFKVRYEGIVAFERPEVFFSFPEDEKVASFRLPLVYDSIESFSDIVVDTRDELSILRTSIINERDKYFLECKFSPSDVRGISAVGEIVLQTKAGFKSNVLCTLNQERFIEIMPARLVFTVGETPSGTRRATAIIRVKSNSRNTKPPKLLTIGCKTPLGVPLSTSIVQVGNNVYRVQVESKKQEDLMEGGKLTWTLRTDLGEDILQESNCILSN